MVRKLLRIGAILTVVVALLVGAAAGVLWVLGPPTHEGYDPGDFEVVGEGDPIVGRRLVELMCVRCHFDPESDALAGRSLGREYNALGRPHASNITRDEIRGIGEWTDAELAMLFRSGVHPRRKELLPPYMPSLPNVSDVDLAHIVAFLRSDHGWVAPHRKADPPSALKYSAVLSAWFEWQPGRDHSVPVLRPDEAEPIALGAYLANDLLQCHGCHSAALDEVDWLVPADTKGFYEGGAVLVDLAQHKVVAPGLTQRAEGGLAGWSYEEFRRALVDGAGKDGAVLRWPMPRYRGLSEGELSALYAYFKTLPAAAEAPARKAPYKVVPQIVDPGRHEFERLGCPSCHDPDAKDYRSLEGITETYPDDASLAAYISDPRSVDANAWMPAYDNLVDEAQMKALLEYVRRRVERGPYAPPPKE
ncbi:MAG: c-type cytochrome [Nannocystaceae bacterium]|nr:hypothetical protein [bacterium]